MCKGLCLCMFIIWIVKIDDCTMFDIIICLQSGPLVAVYLLGGIPTEKKLICQCVKTKVLFLSRLSSNISHIRLLQTFVTSCAVCDCAPDSSSCWLEKAFIISRFHLCHSLLFSLFYQQELFKQQFIQKQKPRRIRRILKHIPLRI